MHDIRGCTGRAQKNSAVLQIGPLQTKIEEIAQIVDITAEDVWIYLQDIPDTQMIEFGRFLPAPGEEAEWEKGMSPEKRASLPK